MTGDRKGACMSEEESKAWFEKQKGPTMFGPVVPPTEEQRYQAYKARLAAESALPLFPDLTDHQKRAPEQPSPSPLPRQRDNERRL